MGQPQCAAGKGASRAGDSRPSPCPGPGLEPLDDCPLPSSAGRPVNCAESTRRSSSVRDVRALLPFLALGATTTFTGSSWRPANSVALVVGRDGHDRAVPYSIRT